MKSRYKRKLFLSFLFLFVVFAAVVSFFQFNREKIFKVEKLETSLKIYNEIIMERVVDDGLIFFMDFSPLDRIVTQMPEKDLRVTLISRKGEVLYDSFVKDVAEMTNHLDRPEVAEAAGKGAGSNIRFSNSTGIDYFYFAVDYGDFFVRTSLPYTKDIRNMLKANLWFIYFIIIVFILLVFLLIYLIDHFGRAIFILKDFAVKAGRNEPIDRDITFEKNELGEIGSQIISIYQRLKQTTRDLSIEKEKLFKHLHYSKEGIAIFSQEKNLIISNNFFVDYVNFISEEILDIDFERIFKMKEIEELNKFLAISVLRESGRIIKDSNQTFKMTVEKNGRHFYFRTIIFDDGSFEISINDITETENARRMKEEMTSNIAHELKTPVAAISGFMETLLANSDIGEERRNQFIERSYKQSQRLAALITDLSVLNKIDDVGKMFEIGLINVKNLLSDILFDLEGALDEKKITVECSVEEDVIISGNKFLTDAVFRNLIDNSIKYGGENIVISLTSSYHDDDYYYFNYYDTGKGVPQKHLTRIFERFYRVDKGRSRTLGGTGLGLSIVKHAVGFHGGNIYAKPWRESAEGNSGIEFVFSLKKKRV